MNVNINLSGFFANNGLSNASSKGNVSINVNKNNKKSSSILGASIIQNVKRTSKKKMSPEAIAKKIAQGKKVSKEEIEFLRDNNPELFRKAMRAKRVRENLEEALKSSKSETAKAAAVAEAMAQASFLAAADEKSQDGESVTVGAGLYSDAIQAALNKYGSKELNHEMKEFMNENTSSKSNQSLTQNNEVEQGILTKKKSERLSTESTT